MSLTATESCQQELSVLEWNFPPPQTVQAYTNASLVMRSWNQHSSGASPRRLHFLFLVDTPLLPSIFNLQNMKTYVAGIPISKMLWFFWSNLSLYDIGAELSYIWSHTCLQTCLAAILISSTGICILASPLTGCPTPCFTSILNWKVATSCVTLCGHALLAQTFYL
jgi:hypothetical protein